MGETSESLAARAKLLRKKSLDPRISPAQRREANRIAKNLDALARHKAKKAAAAR